ncbi:DUF1643 domain-containing protein [Guptibacillus hwajinpoensis]|uniref:DUF1643 domain-containing protein n=1 Tax=Guptibacillus hwajinpoensis TaxID=208199 RepID=UPI0037365656
MGAIISSCGNYRYMLERPSEIGKPQFGPALFIMLNPSTADAEIDDPTIKRCRMFGKTWGCNGIKVANLYALRTTNPTELWTHDDPIGIDNDLYLVNLLEEHKDIMCAWGVNAKRERVEHFIRLAQLAEARLWCLGTTKSGAPKHPLYLKKNEPLRRWISN